MDEDTFESDIEEITKARDAFQNGNWAECFERLNGFLERKWRKHPQDLEDWSHRILSRRCMWFRARLVSEVSSMWAAGEFRNQEHVNEYLEQRAGELLTALKDAQRYLLCSVNDSACLDQLDDVPTLSRVQIDWNVMAACSLKADVVEELLEYHHIYVNVANEPPATPSKFCMQCNEWRTTWVEDDSFCAQCISDGE